MNETLLNPHKQLLSWYALYGRDELPWRNTDDVYAVYVSEIMLQQTQVKRVLEEYYFQFLEKFPSLLALASASLDEVFAMWSGLGYYRRAKNLHESAKLSLFGLPKELKSLQKLPGIGRYTASAICSFGYNQNVSVLDTNIARVLARYFGVEDASQKKLWDLADDFLNHSFARNHNLALMDLGAMVCLPKNPSCELCPFLESCKGTLEPMKYYKTKSKIYEEKKLHFAICVKENKIAMRNSKEGMYKDMLELPMLLESELIEADLQKSFIGSFKHAVTKYRLQVHLYAVSSLDEECHWYALDALDEAPISSMTQKALKLWSGV